MSNQLHQPQQNQVKQSIAATKETPISSNEVKKRDVIIIGAGLSGKYLFSVRHKGS